MSLLYSPQFHMILSGIILLSTLIIFTLGKSPVFRIDRTGAAIIGAAMMIGFNIVSFDQAVQLVDYRTIVLLFSMMIVSAFLKLSGFLNLVANKMIQKIRTRKGLLWAVIFISGILSAFFINDIICLIFTPIVILLCKQSDSNPIPYLIAIATASNIGSSSTLIGNPQNILIGSLSHIPFLSYLVIAAPLAIIGLFLNYYAIAFLYKKDLQGELTFRPVPKGVRHNYLINKSLLVMLCILTGFVLGVDEAIIAVLGAAYLLITRRIKLYRIYALIDYNLLLIFIGLFVIIGGVEQSGLLTIILNKMNIVNLGQFSVFALITVILSNIVSNVPAVLLLKYLIPANDPNLWWVGMAMFSTIAGNLMITGSLANIIVIETAKKQNITVGFMDYLKVGLPLTVILCAIGLVYLSLMGI